MKRISAPTPLLDYTALEYRYKVSLGRLPDDEAQALYRRFPAQCGYALEDGERSPSKFEVCGVLAIAQAYENKNTQVVFVVPKPMGVWACAQFKVLAKTMFGRLKESRDKIKPEDLRKVIDDYKSAFTRVMIGWQPTVTKPVYWASYGFSEHDMTLPHWLREGLM